MKELKNNLRRPIDMVSNLLDITEDLSWCTMTDIAAFITTYGTMIIAEGADQDEMECWIELQKAAVHYHSYRELSENHEPYFMEESAEASRAFTNFCKLATRKFGDKMAIPSWHQVRVHS